MAFFIVLMLIAVPLIIWQIVDPRGAWRIAESWKFRNPEANEPSDTAYELSRVGSVLALIGLLVCGVMFWNLSRDAEQDRAERATSSSTTPYERPDLSPKQSTADLGPGTVLGYVYPSERTIELVVLDGNSGYVATTGSVSCATSVAVYEHTNAIVVQATRSAWALAMYNEEPVSQARLAEECSSATEVPTTASRQLVHPIGDRPIVTAAPLADPASFALAYGPQVRPEPLVEVPRPGVQQRQHPVEIDPSWHEVPLLAAVPER